MVTKSKSLLEQLEERVAVDADTYDVDFIRTLPIVPHDATSNQGFIHAALIDPLNEPLVKGVVDELRGASWEEVYAVCAARLAAKVIPAISGRVLVQVSTRHAYNTPAIVAHARLYDRAYKDAGIAPDRFAIKIPTTSAGIHAALELHKEGITTLGTALFSVPQAIAAAQADMYAISMYYNEPRAHSVPGVWPDVADPATLPMAARHLQIRALYDAHGGPQMKTASFCAPNDVLVCAELGADNVTVGIPQLTDLMEFSTLPEYKPGMWGVPLSEQAKGPARAWHPWVPRDTRGPAIQAFRDDSTASFETDYTAGNVLDEANDADPVTKERLAFALEMFAEMEAKSREFLEGLMTSGDLNYRCHLCHRQYSRSDVLNRHLVQTHGEKTARAGRPRRAACIACVQDRVVCDGVPPKICSRCREATRQCRYRHLEMEAASPPSPQVSLSSGVELSPSAPAAALGECDAREDLLGLWGGWAADIVLSATNTHTHAHTDTSTSTSTDTHHRGLRAEWFPEGSPELLNARRDSQEDEGQEVFWGARVSPAPALAPGPITPAAFATMHALTQHAHRPIWSAPHFPSETALAAYVDLYRCHFWLPLEPALDKAAPLLLKAVAGLGSVYARESTQLMELVRRDLLFIREHDARFMHDIAVLQTTLLAAVYGAFSGSPRWAQLAEGMRATLVAAARRLFDAQASLFSTPFVPLCEIDGPLPGVSRVPGEGGGFRAVLATLLETGTLPPSPDDLTLAVLAHALHRLCLDAAAASAFTPWDGEETYALPVVYRIHPQALLDQLARHTLRAPAPSALVVSCAAVAYHAHLRFASPRFLEDVKAGAGRWPGGREEAQACLGAWMAANPRGARDVVAHAAMLFALVAQFSFDAPHEAVYLFDAALCMWAILEFGGMPSGDVVLVSWAPTPAVETWIESGIGSLAVPGVGLGEGGPAVLKAAAGRLAMSPWGIAAQYRRVLLRLQGEQQERRRSG
ncbi:hypothetical protein CspeluHIS016_0702160 [Cutaneotrichosporon spelunceum]|uniref:Transaldolase n=1 Tax=Cutaneotrichosporon spelunceum TaxID=1672016 RepID=A0AAD3TYG9_9TREE|nr:hypothetical protein CspeluHIS016_0702160 [Cutaneotrichosporon spelunceum]